MKTLAAAWRAAAKALRTGQYFSKERAEVLDSCADALEREIEAASVTAANADA